MTVREAIDYINDYTWSSSRLGLERTRELLERLGNPQKSLKFIHVAGTNGKGSTCAMIERILREAGFCTGFYPSPYLQDFRERIQVNGEYITESRLAAITACVAAQADAMEDHPSQFELITAIGMLYFLEMHCDYVVLEVGMGGALDSTNVIDPPEVAVITNIGLDHTEYLGSTVEEIACTKCGILKRGSSAVCYRNTPQVMAVIRKICHDRMIPLYEAPPVESDAQDGEDTIKPLGHSLEGQRFLYRGREYRLPLLGKHQLRNAATVLKIVEALRDRGIILPDEAVERGLALTEWPARFEVLSREPLLILDGGHNPQCAEALAENIREYLADESGRAEVTFLFGMLADKDYRQTLELLAPYGAAYVCITPENPRALPGEELAEVIRSAKPGLPVVSVNAIPDAIAAALETGKPVIAFGSLYSAGAIRSEAAAVIKRCQRKQALRARRALSPEAREEARKIICEKLEKAVQNLREGKEIRRILSYAASTDEVNVDAFNRWAGEEGMEVLYPRCEDGGVMEARAADEGTDAARMLEPGAFGIREPKKSFSHPVPPEEIDLVIVPCVGFDSRGGRIGHGKGYYDRYLPRLRPDAERILVAFEAQRLPEVRMDRCDLPIPRIITEAAGEKEKETGFCEGNRMEEKKMRETQIGTEDIFAGKILDVKRDQVRLPNGHTGVREIIRHVGAVCVVPVTEDGKVVVERQYRYPIDRVITEIPAGKLDSREEDRLSAAKRELWEETGISADRWTDMGLYFGAPAYSDEKITMYLAQDLHRGEQHLDEDEFLNVSFVPMEELVDEILRGEITDGKTQVAILKAALLLKKQEESRA